MNLKPKGWSGARVFAAAVAVLVMLSVAASWRSPLARALAAGKPVYGLLIGTDLVDYARHADTILLLRYDPSSRKLDALSIPRDTRINLPRLRVKRVNEVYAYAYRESRKDSDAASRELCRAVRWILRSGTSAPAGSSPIDFYAQVDYDGFRRIVDILGGAPVTVDRPMHYDDDRGKLHIHFEPGRYLLDGQKALEYVRFRDRVGDFGRMGRQQEFFLTLFGRFRHPANLVRLPQLAWVSLRSMRTNLSGFERLLLLTELKDLTRERIRIMQLPGGSRAGYWMTDPDGVAATSRLLGLDEAAGPAPEEEEDPIEPAARTTVEVWNASGRAGLARKVIGDLRAAGFDVVKWGNYASRQQRTSVRDRRGNMDQARAVLERLSAPRAEVFTRLETDPFVDIEVILGEDMPGSGAPEQ